MECQSKADCSSKGIGLECVEGRCSCGIDKVQCQNRWEGIACYAKVQLFDSCVCSNQCLALNRNTICDRNNHCTCSPGFMFDGRDHCVIRYDTNIKAQEVYKAAVVAAACFIVAIVGIFVACIVRRSFCRRDSSRQHGTNSNNDVFSISDEIAALRAVDKPPSYEEVLQIERTFFGIPPPEYSSVRGPSQTSSATPNIINYFTSSINPPGFQQIDTATSESSTTSNSTIVTALVSNFSEASSTSVIDVDSCTTSSKENILKSNTSRSDSTTRCHNFLPDILRSLTRHASLLHRTSPASRLSHLQSSSSSTSLPNSPQSVHRPTILSPSNFFSSDTVSESHSTPSRNEQNSLPSDILSSDLSPTRSLQSRRDSLILDCEEAYVNSGFIEDNA